MTRIIIIDGNPSAGALLKRTLEQELDQVGRVDHWRSLTQKSNPRGVKLVLIRQTCRDGSAWTQFNQLKQENSQIPAMIYVLPDYQQNSMNWIIKAVQEVLSSA